MEVIFLYGLGREEALRYYGQQLENTHTLVDYDENTEEDAIVRSVKDKGRIVVILERTNGAKLTALAATIKKSVAASLKCIKFGPKSDQVGIVEEFRHYEACIEGSEYVKIPELDLDSSVIDTDQGQFDLTLQLVYKLEVPVLVIEYSALLSDEVRHQQFIQLVNSWRDFNAVSQVVLLSNGVDQAELEIGLQRVDIPIYVLENWNRMPVSGIGFLVPFLRMDLEESFLLFESPQLRQAADRMGLRSCQLEEILSTPRLLTTKNAYSNPRMLRLTVLPRTGSSSEPSLPLYARETVPPGNRVDTVLTVTDSCTIRLFAADRQVLLKYCKLLERHSTRVGEPGSLKDLNRKRRDPGKKRSLPEWFTNLSPTKKLKTSPKSKDPSLPTEYVMDEQELVKHASEVLESGH